MAIVIILKEEGISGKFEVMGNSITDAEKFTLAGALPRITQLLQSSPVLSRTMKITIEGRKVIVSPDSEKISQDNLQEFELLRSRLIEIANELSKQLLSI